MSKQKGWTVIELIMVIGIYSVVLGGLVSCTKGEKVVPVVTVTGSMINAEVTMSTAKQYCRKFGSTVKTLQAYWYIGIGGGKSKVTLVCNNDADFEGIYNSFIKLAGTKETLDIEDSIE